MRIILSLVFIFHLSFYIEGQVDYISDIGTFSSSSDKSNKLSMIFFHFEGCAPCKIMEKEVLLDKDVSKVLQEKFDVYSVYGFDTLENTVRKLYNIKSNPAFLFVDQNGTPIHLLVGLFDKAFFLEELDKISQGDHHMSLFFDFDPKAASLEKYADYIHSLEHSGKIEPDDITQYLNSIPDSVYLTDSVYLKDLMHFGFFKGKNHIHYGSKYHKILEQAFDQKLFHELNKHLRDRIYFILSEKMYAMSLADTSYSSIYAKMRKLEDGNRILLHHLHKPYVLAVQITNYPSFNLTYDKLVAGNQEEEASTLFYNFLNEIEQTPSVLNTFAWGIYQGTYIEPVDVGLNLIKKALSIEEKYNYLDTYAHLLYKSNDFKKAEEIANKAIIKAKEEGKAFDDTEILISRLNDLNKD